MILIYLHVLFSAISVSDDWLFDSYTSVMCNLPRLYVALEKKNENNIMKEEDKSETYAAGHSDTSWYPVPSQPLCA